MSSESAFKSFLQNLIHGFFRLSYLIFTRNNEMTAGGQIVNGSECSIKHIDAITVAIRSGLSVVDLITLRCAGQPELPPDPGMEPISLAAEGVFDRLRFRELQEYLE
jgi:hypothetical protein